MHLSMCFTFFLLGIALAQAGPMAKITKKKSLLEDTKLESKKTALNIEETGENKDRDKKSTETFCIQINPGSSQPTQVSCKKNQATVQKIPLAIQTEPVPQQIQTLSMLQPVVQLMPQASIVMPQSVVQPISTLQIVQPVAQPCAQTIPSVNIIQSAPQSNVIQTISKPKPKPKPTSAPTVDIKTTTEQLKPTHIEQFQQPLPEPQKTLAMMPVASPCNEHIITIPSSPVVVVPEFDQNAVATIVQVPSVSSCGNPLCSCQNNIAVLGDSDVESMATQILPAMSYSSSFVKSPMMMPYDFNILPHGHMEKLEPQGGTSPSVSGIVPRHHHHNYQTTYLKTTLHGVGGFGPDNLYTPYFTKPLVDTMYGPKGVTINAFPQTYQAPNPMLRSAQISLRNQENASNSPSAFEASELMQSNKTPRETVPNQLIPEKTIETKQQEGQVFLIDGRRSTRSNKEETKQKDRQTSTN